MALPLLVDGERRLARVAFGADGLAVTLDGVTPTTDARLIASDGGLYVLRKGRQTFVAPDLGGGDHQHDAADGVVRAPMHGKLLALLVDKDVAVDKGHRLAVIEAMKMEHTLLAPISGVVSEINAAAGEQIAEGAVLMVIAESVAEET